MNRMYLKRRDDDFSVSSMDMELKRLWSEAALGVGSCMEGGRGGRRGGAPNECRPLPPPPHLGARARHSLCRLRPHLSHLRARVELETLVTFQKYVTKGPSMKEVQKVSWILDTLPLFHILD